jgi:hypothetical protein
MKNTLAVATIYEEDNSDALSSGAPSESLNSFEEDSFMQSPYDDNSDGISTHSKKIAKRRCAYQKIDDDIRLQLLEAVQKKRETLKSASKRLGINYSSAKSILHTYRKEGRILKKSLLERVIPSSHSKNTQMELSPMAAKPQVMPKSHSSHSSSFKRINLAQKSNMTSTPLTQKDFSPMNGLTTNFGHLFLNAAVHLKEEANAQKSQVSGFTLIPTIKLPVQVNEPSPSNTQIHLQHMLKPVVNQSPNNPLGVLKSLDNFYLNYSNSPLSGGAANIFTSDSSSNRQFPTEFDSFSEMVSALQNQPCCTINKSAGDLYLPKTLPFNSPRFPFNRIDAGIPNEENAVHMIRGLIETQQLLSDTIQTASYINNLMQIQKTSPGVSPCSIWAKH